MKKFNYITLAALCLILTSCSEETSSTLSNEINQNASADVQMEESTSENPVVAERNGVQKDNISGNRGAMMELPEEFESMSEEEKANYFAEQGIELPEDMEAMLAKRENMDMSDKAAMRENMGVSNGFSSDNWEYPEGFEEMTEEERSNYFAEQGIELPEDMEAMLAMRENMDMSDKAAMRENMGSFAGNKTNSDANNVETQGSTEESTKNPEDSTANSTQVLTENEANTFKGEVVEIVDNEFLLVSEDGIEKTIVIPKDFVIANGDYTRILLGMNENEYNTV